MSPTPAVRVSEKQLACRKLMSLLQKEYGRNVPRLSLPVLETMLFAICLEDNPWLPASNGYERLLRTYFDLNEIRVSSVTEIEETLSDLRDADWKGLRIRAVLRFVFETTWSFDYEKLRRLTVDSAQKRLNKIEALSPFIRSFTLQQCLGGYLLSLDAVSTRAAIHLGLVPPESSDEQAAEFLKPGLKKADTFAFAYYLRCLATDPKFAARFETDPDDPDLFNPTRVEQALENLRKPPSRRKKVTPGKPPTAAARSTAKRAGRAAKSSDSGSGTAGTRSRGKTAGTKPAGQSSSRKKTATAGTGRSSEKKATGGKSAGKQSVPAMTKKTKKKAARRNK